jgi:hypothetical protein
MSYDFQEHKHRYAVWTAARAQRSFTTTGRISAAIHATTLRSVCESSTAFTVETFDEQHRRWAERLMNSFPETEKSCSYGRAAKIIAIYIRTSVVLPSQGESSLALVAHPPIDSILLTALSEEESFRDLQGKRWTRFTVENYWEMVNRIRSAGLPFNWQLESYWKPERAINK